jgi:hypothetical protein
VLLGVVPAIGFGLVQLALDASMDAGGQGYATALAKAASVQSGFGTGVEQFQSAALFVPLVFALVLGVMFLVARSLSKLGSASRRAAAPWLCGYVREADCHRYSAHNFYGEIKRYFRWLGGAPRPPGEQPSAKP